MAMILCLTASLRQVGVAAMGLGLARLVALVAVLAIAVQAAQELQAKVVMGVMVVAHLTTLLAAVVVRARLGVTVSTLLLALAVVVRAWHHLLLALQSLTQWVQAVVVLLDQAQHLVQVLRVRALL
jgi:hypothetical protein